MALNESESVFGKSVKDFGAKGDGVTDDTLAIQRAFNEADEIFFPVGVYKVTNTLYFDGRKSGYPYRFVGKSITFSPRAKILLYANVDGIIFRGSGSTIQNMYIEIYNNIINYDSTVLTLEALDNHTNACESNLFDNLKIFQSWGVKKGTAIKMMATGVSYIYKNKFTNLEINHFYHGIKATTNGSLGINSNIFSGSIWASQQSMHLNGASGNIFNLTIQNTTTDPNNPELANVYVNGEYNQFMGLIYDVANNGLVKYAYEFGENGVNNSIGIHYKKSMIKNPHGNFNFLQEISSSMQEQFVLENNPSSPFMDYRDVGGAPLPIKTFRMISGLDNSLGRMSVVESISATSTNMQFWGVNPVTNPDSVRKLFNPNKLLTVADNLIFDAVDRTKPSRFEITLNLINTTQEYFLVKSIGVLLGQGGAILGTGNVGQSSVKAITKDGREIVYDRIGGDKRQSYHTNNQILFLQNQEPAFHWTNQTRSIVLTFTFPANSFTRQANIAYLYANAVSSYGNTGSFAYIGGDKFDGDIEFNGRAGVVIKSPNGSRYRITVSDTGALSATKL